MSEIPAQGEALLGGLAWHRAAPTVDTVMRQDGPCARVGEQRRDPHGDPSRSSPTTTSPSHPQRGDALAFGLAAGPASPTTPPPRPPAPAPPAARPPAAARPRRPPARRAPAARPPRPARAARRPPPPPPARARRAPARPRPRPPRPPPARRPRPRARARARARARRARRARPPRARARARPRALVQPGLRVDTEAHRARRRHIFIDAEEHRRQKERFADRLQPGAGLASASA